MLFANGRTHTHARRLQKDCVSQTERNGKVQQCNTKQTHNTRKWQHRTLRTHFSSLTHTQHKERLKTGNETLAAAGGGCSCCCCCVVLASFYSFTFRRSLHFTPRRNDASTTDAHALPSELHSFAVLKIAYPLLLPR